MIRLPCEGIVFDMDGVLVDVSGSYREAIVRTVKQALGGLAKIATDDIEAMKKIPGFNNDWDLSYVLARLLQEGATRDRFHMLAQPPSATTRVMPEYARTKDIFQAYYLGGELFRRLYTREPPIAVQEGLMNEEIALLRLDVLQDLASTVPIGVATSRPRFEALWALDNLAMRECIPDDRVVAQEDAPREKPSPDPLLEARRRMVETTGMNLSHVVYVGDTVNDVKAAAAAGMACVFVGSDRLGDVQVQSANSLMEVLNLGRRRGRGGGDRSR